MAIKTTKTRSFSLLKGVKDNPKTALLNGVIILFLLYIYLISIFWNLGFSFNMGKILAPALGILFYYIGVLLEKAKRNWFIGIRTPWTLSDDSVWEKTHKIGGKLFKIAGLIALLSVLLPARILYLTLVPALAASLFLVVYSYFKYREK